MKHCVVGGMSLLLAAALAPTVVDAMSTTVNCPGDSIAGALAAGFDEITVNGTCTENVVIKQDDVTIQGDGNDTVVGELSADGARRITIQNLTITGGPGNGILAINGATVTAANLLIENVPHVGVNSLRNASVVADNVTVRNASFGVSVGDSGNLIVNGSLLEQIALNGADVFNGGTATLNQVTIRGATTGIFAGANAYVEVTGSTIENSGDAGISLHRGADGLLTASAIQNNGGAGILLDTNCSAFGGDLTIAGNGGVGVGVIQGSTAVLANLTVENNGDVGIDIARGSSGVFSNSTIENNGEVGIHVGYSSTADLDSNTIQASAIGVSVEFGASALLRSNSITATTTDDAALDMDWGASVRLAGGNMLKASPIGFSIFMQQGSTLNQRSELDTVAGPVWLRSFSNAEFRKVKITGNVQIEDHSLARFRELSNDGNVAVTGNISVSRDSGLNFVGGLPVRVVGDIGCADQESSLAKDNLSLTGKIKPGCTGYQAGAATPR